MHSSKSKNTRSGIIVSQKDSKMEVNLAAGEILHCAKQKLPAKILPLELLPLKLLLNHYKKRMQFNIVRYSFIEESHSPITRYG